LSKKLQVEGDDIFFSSEKLSPRHGGANGEATQRMRRALAEIRTYTELMAALRARMVELGIARNVE
jgi:hypothetical protein